MINCPNKAEVTAASGFEWPQQWEGSKESLKLAKDIGFQLVSRWKINERNCSNLYI